MTEPPGNGKPTLDTSTPGMGWKGRKKIAGGLASLSGWVYNPLPRFERHLSHSGPIDRESDLVNRSIFKAARHYSIANCRHFGYVYPS